MTGALEPDWLVEELWPRYAPSLVAGVARVCGVDEERADPAARDVFAALLLAEPRLRARGPGPERLPPYAAALGRLLDDAQVRALRSLTAGDEDAAASWVPAVAAELLRGGEPAGPGPGGGDADGRGDGDSTGSGDGDGAPDGRPVRDASGSASGIGDEAGSGATAPYVDVVGAGGAGAPPALRRLLAACRRGVADRTGVAARRGPSRSPGCTRDPSQVQAAAWSALCTPATESALWRRWAGPGLPARPEPGRRRRAPLVVVVDESGSMELLLDGTHTRRTWAGGVVVACAEIARAGRRPLVYLGFSGPGQCRTHRLAPGDGPDRLREVLAGFYGGGTDVAEPLRRATALLDAEAGGSGGGADVLIVGDGEADVPAETVTAWERCLARTGSRCWAVRIGGAEEPTGGPDPTPLETLAHGVCDLEDFGRAELAARFPALAHAARGTPR
ncbi:vWA domain-containing protein [Pseudonocardia phyllosphaerae]|uniref:vWA domain-containing protein n=1 Tax=Pseudonocardia phyllosphaerae TaxID=3390502 RepID=UPI00397E0E62